MEVRGANTFSNDIPVISTRLERHFLLNHDIFKLSSDLSNLKDKYNLFICFLAERFKFLYDTYNPGQIVRCRGFAGDALDMVLLPPPPPLSLNERRTAKMLMRMMYYSVMTQAYSEKEIPSSPNRSRTYDLPITSSDALPLSYRRLVRAKAIKLG